MENKTLEKQIRPSVFELTPYVPAKPVEEMREELGLSRIVKLDANENALGTSPLALQAMESQMGSLNRYPDGYFQGLRRALAKHWHVDEEQVIAGNGSDEVLSLIAQTFLGEGDEMIVVDPTFSSYEFYATIMGARVIHLSLEPDTYGLSVDGLLGAVTDRCKIVCVCTPNNPTGLLIDAASMERLVRELPKDVLLVVDEAYFEYVTDERAVSAAEYLDEVRLLLVSRTFSKIYGLAALRVGYALTSKAVAGFMGRVRSPFNINSLAQAAAAAAIGDEAHREASRAMNEEGKRFLYGKLKELGVPYLPTQANFIFAKTGNAARVREMLLEKGVVIRASSSYGEDWVRITIGTMEENRILAGALAEVLAER